MKIGILTSTIREGRVSLDVANWVLEQSKINGQGLEYEIVDLKDYDLPFLGGNVTEAQGAALGRWIEKINSLDGFVFTVAEYNHAPSGVFKNALDFLKAEFKNKPIGFVGYGGVGGARAIEHLRLVVAEYGAATIQKNVNFMLAFDFVNYTEFNPMDFHATVMPEFFTQLADWTKALKTLR